MSETSTKPSGDQIAFLLELLNERVEGLVREAVAAGPEAARQYLDIFEKLSPQIGKVRDAVSTLRQLLVNIDREAEDHRRAWAQFAALIEVRS